MMLFVEVHIKTGKFEFEVVNSWLYQWGKRACSKVLSSTLSAFHIVLLLFIVRAAGTDDMELDLIFQTYNLRNGMKGAFKSSPLLLYY